MTKIIGKPNENNEILKKILDKAIISEKYINNNLEFRDEILSEIKNDMCILDIGKSMRDRYEKILCKEKKTLDINLFEDYPDFQCDLSEETKTINTDLLNKFDVKTLNQVESFLNQPGKWSRNNGGK